MGAWVIAKEFVKGIPWQAWALAAVLLALWGYGAHERHVGAREVQAKFDKHLAADKSASEAAKKAAQAKEDRDRASFATAAEQLKRDNAHALALRDSTIADLRAGAIKLRRHFTCPVSQAAAGAGRSNETDQAGLSESDAGFLVRFANDADNAARQLAACQETLRAERQ